MTETRTRALPAGNPTGADDGTVCTSGQWLAANADLDRIDAQLLAAQVLGIGRAQILAFPETGLTRRQVSQLDQLAGRVRAREPLAYIRGRKEFFGLDFRVGEDVLVPRPDTELLVELAIRLARRNARVLEPGTGSGCIAVALKRERPDLSVTAIDVSFAALARASENAAAAGARIDFVQGDWLDALHGPFDCIVANPPYVAEGDPALATLRLEPRLALVAGADGLSAINRIVEQAIGRLARSGFLILEHGWDQASSVRARLARAGYRRIETHRDLAGHERATVAVRGP